MSFDTIDDALSKIHEANELKKQAQELHLQADEARKQLILNSSHILNESTAELVTLKEQYRIALQQLSIATSKAERAEKVIANSNVILENIIDRKDQIFQLLDTVHSNPKSGVASTSGKSDEVKGPEESIGLLDKEVSEESIKLDKEEDPETEDCILPRTLINGYIPLASIGILPLFTDYVNENVNPVVLLNIFIKHYLEFVLKDGPKTDGMVALNQTRIIRGDIDFADIEEDLRKGNNYLVEREAVVKMLQKYWLSSTKPFEHHLNACTEKGEDHKGVYQGITFPSTLGMWKWLRANPLFQNLVDIYGLINVVDAGSGLNGPCIIGAYMTGIIKMGIGIEGDKHKAGMAAQCAHS